MWKRGILVFITNYIKEHELYEKKEINIRNTHINIGSGKEISIKDLAFLIKNIVKYDGDFIFNKSKPNGTLRKLTDVSKINKLGWKHKVSLDDGLKRLYRWYIE